MGNISHEGNVGLLTPEQQSSLSGLLGSQGNQGAYSEFLQPYDPGKFQDLFQKSFVDPSTQHLQRDIIPQLKEGLLGQNEAGSSALNRALAQSATDLSTNLGQQYMNFFNQQQQNKLGALGQLGGLSTQRTFDPMIQQTQGILGPLLNLLGQGGIGLGMGLGGR